ncbi:MAG: aminotransferase class V-fold PLP-dependent enzyme [Pseudomonadota bacterium]
MSEQPPKKWPCADGYLLNHSAGLPPTTSSQDLQNSLYGPWTAEDGDVWSHWLDAIYGFRVELAAILGSTPGLVCPQLSVSAALTQILGSLTPAANRNRLLISEKAFPSLGFVFQQLERRGYEVVMVPRALDTQDANEWRPFLDERVHCVLITHVHSNTGECHDIPSLATAARDIGAISIVDVAQSIGIREVDARHWGADFIIGSCIKWLCGGSGAAFLWVSEERLDECEPIDVGWFSHADPFEFDIHSFAYAPDALRFWGGTPSVSPAIIAAHSIASLREVGMASIREQNQVLTELLIAGLPERAVVSPRTWAHRGGSVVVQLGEKQAGFIKRLREADVKFDVRREGIRLSPHFYNTKADIERVLGCQ